MRMIKMRILDRRCGRVISSGGKWVKKGPSGLS